MKAFFIRYLNEFVGLTVMTLMAIAIVAAEADAEIQRAAVEEARSIIEIRLTVGDGKDPAVECDYPDFRHNGE